MKSNGIEISERRASGHSAPRKKRRGSRLEDNPAWKGFTLFPCPPSIFSFVSHFCLIPFCLLFLRESFPLSLVYDKSSRISLSRLHKSYVILYFRSYRYILLANKIIHVINRGFCIRRTCCRLKNLVRMDRAFMRLRIERRKYAVLESSANYIRNSLYGVAYLWLLLIRKFETTAINRASF